MTWHVKCQVGVAYRYNDLAKVSAVETIQNEIGGFKSGRKGRSISVPEKVPGTANPLQIPMTGIEAIADFKIESGLRLAPDFC